jgi:hypothetical protein
MRGVVVLTLLVGCGRYGFSNGVPDALDESSQKADASPAIDADPTIDTPIGMGSYAITETVSPYTAPTNAQPIPAFTIDSDEEAFPLPLPFTFTFYSVPYTNVSASVNGFLTFGAMPTSVESYLNDCPFDGSAPDAMIAVFWDDLLSPDAMPNGTMSTSVEGAAPDRRFTVEWRDLDAFYQAGGGNNFFSQGVRVTQKVVLHEDGRIDLHYGPRTQPTQNKDCGLARHLGCSATVGLEAAGNTLSTFVQCGTAVGPMAGYGPLDDGRLITFTPN